MAERRIPILPRSRWVWPAVALGALLLFNLLFTEGFFRLEMKSGHLFGSLIDILDRAAPLILVSLGMTLVIATAGVDLSVGAVMAISGSLAAVIVTDLGGGVWIALMVAGLAATVAGTWNGVLVAFLGVPPIVATLILMVAGRGVAQLVTDGQIVTFSAGGLVALGSGYFLGLPLPVTIAAVAFAVTALLTRGTALGLFLECVGDNEVASRLTGIRTRDVKLMAYAFSGLCAGIAGLIVAADIRAADANSAGLYLELDAILAVVVGGTALTGGRFQLAGSLLGALIIQTLTTTILTRGVQVELTLVIKAVVVLAVCLLQGGSAAPSPPAAPGGAVRISRQHVPLLASLVVFVSLYLVAGIRDERFLSLQVFVNLLRDNSFLGLAAIGMTFVILSGGIDLSVGAVIGFTSIFTATLIEQHGLHPLAVMPLALGAGALFGAGQGALITLLGLPPFLVTLAGMFLARGTGYLVGLEAISIEHPFYTGVAEPLWQEGLPPTAAIFLLALIAAIFVSRQTRFGRRVHAIGGDEESARLLGLPVRSVKVGVYAVSGLCAAAAGLLHTFYTSSGNAGAASMLELDAIAAVVIGGTLLSGGVGGVAGTALGVLILGVIQTAITFEGTLSSWWTKIAVGGLLLLFILLQRLVQGRGGSRRSSPNVPSRPGRDRLP